LCSTDTKRPMAYRRPLETDLRLALKEKSQKGFDRFLIEACNQAINPDTAPFNWGVRKNDQYRALEQAPPMGNDQAPHKDISLDWEEPNLLPNPNWVAKPYVPFKLAVDTLFQKFNAEEDLKHSNYDKEKGTYTKDAITKRMAQILGSKSKQERPSNGNGKKVSMYSLPPPSDLIKMIMNAPLSK
jgi:hypothetical protein